MKAPETLYVVEESLHFPWPRDLKHLVGYEGVGQAVPDNGQENEVAVYQLVSVGKYKKTVTQTSLVEKVG